MNKCSLDCCKLLVNFQSPQSWFWVADVLITITEQLFGGSYSAILTDVLSLLVFRLKMFPPNLTAFFVCGAVHWLGVLNFDVIKFVNFSPMDCTLGVFYEEFFYLNVTKIFSFIFFPCFYNFAFHNHILILASAFMCNVK